VTAEPNADAAAVARGARELLVEAHALVASGWCQGTCARDSAGTPVLPWMPGARCWSIMGALACSWRSRRNGEIPWARDDPATDAYLLAAAALDRLLRCGPQTWNDAPARTKQSVLQALDDALTETQQVRPEVAELWQPVSQAAARAGRSVPVPLRR
jgi:hypothetical protein